MKLRRLSTATWTTIAGLIVALPATAAIALSVSPGSTRTLVGSAVAREPALAAAAGFGWIVLLTGIGLLTLSPDRAARDARRGYTSSWTSLGLLTIAAVPANAVTLAYRLLRHSEADTPAPPDVLVVGVVALEAALLGLLYFRVVRPRVLTWRELGISGDHLVVRLLGGSLLTLGILFVSAIIGVVLRTAGVEQTQARLFAGVQAGSGLGLLAVALAAGTIVPIAEESFFRGYVFGSARRSHGRLFAYLFSAAFFGLVHLNLPALAPLVAIGLLLAAVRDLSGSLIPGMVAHGLNNALALVALYYARNLPT